MTPTERRECLNLLHWSQRGLADVLGWDESTVRRWMRNDGEAPAEIDDWLARLADFHRAYPPPRRA
jgi:hypothetical protein